MKKAPIPEYEKMRLEALKRLGILNTAPEKRFDRITSEAIEVFKVPISTISLIDSDREWFKSCQGIGEKAGDRSISFCGHALLVDYIFIVEDALKDERFADSPLVTKQGIRFYVGKALCESSSRLPVGVFCIKDFKPKKLTPFELAAFLKLSKEAEKELNRIG